MGCPSLKILKEKSVRSSSSDGFRKWDSLIKIWNSQSSMETNFISVAHLTRQGNCSSSAMLCFEQGVRKQRIMLCLLSNVAQINSTTYAPKCRVWILQKWYFDWTNFYRNHKSQRGNQVYQSSSLSIKMLKHTGHVSFFLRNWWRRKITLVITLACPRSLWISKVTYSRVQR